MIYTEFTDVATKSKSQRHIFVYLAFLSEQTPRLGLLQNYRFHPQLARYQETAVLQSTAGVDM